MKSTYQNKDWDSLSAAAKAEIAKVAIRKGIYSLDGIKSMYNEFAMGGDTSSTVPLGRRYWQAQSNAPTILEKKNTWVKQQKAIKDRKDKTLRKWLQTEGVKELNREVKDYLTTSNDNTWTTSNRNPKNPHLQARFTKGAKAHASWEKEHPVLSTWGNVLGAVPFAVASAPLVATAGSGMAALGDAVAATSAGQAITAGLTPLVTAASTSIAGAPLYTWADVGLSSLFGGHGIQTAINEGGISPETALEIAPLGRLAKPMWDVGKQGLQYTVKGVDNATRYASPSYDLYRTIGETPVSKGSFQRSLTEDFGIFAGPKRVTIFDTPYRQTLDDSFNLIKEPAKAPKQYGMRFSGKHGNYPEVLGEDGRWHGNVAYYKNKRFSDPIDNSIIVGKESKYQPTDYLFHYDTGNYPIHYNADGSPMLHRLPNRNGDLGPIWWSENSKWGDKSVVEPRLIKAPDYGKYRQNLVGDNIGDSDAILTGDYPLKDAEFLERDNLLGTMRRGIFAQQPTVKTAEAPTIEWKDAASTAPKVNWDADNWFKTISGRSSYSSEEAAELASHVPEYRAIEQRLFNEGKLALDSNGNAVVAGSKMSPQEYIMRQSEAFQKMNPEHHYVGVSKRLRNSFENESRDPATKNRYEVWTDRKSPKNVEEYAESQQGGSTNDSNIESLQDEMTIREENYNLHQEQLKWKYEHGKISQETYNQDLKALKDNYTEKQKEAQKELDVLVQRKHEDPLNGGKVFDITYPKEATETPIINAENNHWTSIPFDNVVRDAPNVVTHYKQRPYSNKLQTDQIVSAARRNGYGVTHIDNVMDTYNGEILNETIIGRDTPIKSVLGNTGNFDIESPNKWKLYRSLLPPFIGLGTLSTMYEANKKALGGYIRKPIG